MTAEPATLTPAIFALLLVLRDAPRHGYALMAEVEQLTEGTIVLGPATLYRSLQRMRVGGLIEETAEELESVAEQADRRAERRRSYRITDEGITAVRAEARRLALLVRAARQAGVLNGREGS